MGSEMCIRDRPKEGKSISIFDIQQSFRRLGIPTHIVTDDFGDRLGRVRF